MKTIRLRQRIMFILHCFLIPSLLGACTADEIESKIRTFEINFVVLSSKLNINSAITSETAKREVEILNTKFVSKNNVSPVSFKFKALHKYNDIRDSKCEFVEIGDFTGKYVSQFWQNHFNSCRDRRVVDPLAINFYIIDSYSTAKGFGEKTSHGKNNRNRPYIILDWERLGHTVQSPEEHEMGHAFGLSHECVPGATTKTSTNIMVSAECGEGSGGKRDIGFSEKQVNIILRNADGIAEKLR